MPHAPTCHVSELKATRKVWTQVSSLGVIYPTIETYKIGNSAPRIGELTPRVQLHASISSRIKVRVLANTNVALTGTKVVAIISSIVGRPLTTGLQMTNTKVLLHVKNMTC